MCTLEVRGASVIQRPYRYPLFISPSAVQLVWKSSLWNVKVGRACRDILAKGNVCRNRFLLRLLHCSTLEISQITTDPVKRGARPICNRRTLPADVAWVGMPWSCPHHAPSGKAALSTSCPLQGVFPAPEPTAIVGRQNTAHSWFVLQRCYVL